MKHILFFLIVLLGSTSFAQKIRISGTVKDSVGNPLALANVIAYKKADNAMASYGITNDAGQFKLDVNANETYLLKVSYIGLFAEDLEVTTTEGDVENIAFKMTEDTNSLDEVELVYEIPVVVKGDTLVYNTDSFTNGTEKKLKDVLEKLPGVEVNEDGEIEVEGKTVSKVMVEGKEFFDGDSKLATENIPADALEKVEVLKNFDDVSQLKGLRNTQDEIAINIKLKEGKKNFWFGDITAGVGLDERYLVKPKLFYYSPNYSINILTDLNNIGEVPFTLRDYFKFTGGFRNLGRSGTSFDIGGNDLAFATLQNNRASDINTKFGAANFSVTANKKLDISGFGIFNSSRTELVTNTTRTYIDNTVDETDNTIEQTANQTTQKTDLGMLKLSASYRPNTDFRLDYDVFGKLSNQEEFSLFTSTRDISENIEEEQSQKPFSIEQSLNAYYTQSEKNIFALSSNHVYQDEDPFYNAIREEVPFRGIFTTVDPLDPTNPQADIYDPLLQADRYNINQEKNVKTSKLDAKLDYYHVINKKNHLNLTVGGITSRQQFDSNIFQILDDGTQNNFEDLQYNNDVTYGFNDVYLGTHYKFKTGIFTFNPGVNLHRYTLRDEQLNTIVKQEDWRLLPDVYIGADLKKTESLRLNYSMTAEYTDINRLAAGYIFNNYSSLSRGNRDLEGALYDNYTLSYSNFNMFNYTNIFAQIGYNNKRNPIKNNTEIEGINRVNTSINSNLEDQVFYATGRYDRSFRKFKIRLNANVNWSSFNNIVNNNASESKSLTQTYKGEFSTNFKKGPNFDLGYSISINDYDNNSIKNTFYTSRPFAKLDWAFAKGFLLKSSYSYYNYSDTNSTLNSYSFFDAELYYQKKDSKWEYKLGVTNILNTESLNSDNFNELYNSTSSYVIQPRYWLLSVKYNL